MTKCAVRERIMHIEAEPLADLCEALLNTCYVTSLVKFEHLRFTIEISFFSEMLGGLCMSDYYTTFTYFLFSRNLGTPSSSP